MEKQNEDLKTTERMHEYPISSQLCNMKFTLRLTFLYSERLALYKTQKTNYIINNA